MKKILLVASTTGYQIREFYEAARALGIELVLATDRCHILDNPWGDDAASVRFEDPRPASPPSRPVDRSTESSPSETPQPKSPPKPPNC